MAPFAYPKPFEFGSTGDEVTTVTLSGSGPSSSEETGAKRNTHNGHPAASPRRLRAPESPSRHTACPSPTRERQQQQPQQQQHGRRDVSLSPVPMKRRGAITASKSNDDTLMLMGASTSTAPIQRGLGPKTKSGRMLPKPAPSLPIRGVKVSKSGPLEHMSSRGMSRSPSPTPKAKVGVLPEPPPASPQTPSGRKQSSLKIFFAAARSRSLSRSGRRSCEEDTQEEDDEMAEEDEDINDNVDDKHSIRSSSSRGFRIRIPIVSRRGHEPSSPGTVEGRGGGGTTTTAVVSSLVNLIVPSSPSTAKNKLSSTADEVAVSAAATTMTGPSTSADRSQRHSRRHRRTSESTEEETTTKRKTKSFQELLGSKKMTTTKMTGHSDRAHRSTVGVDDPPPAKNPSKDEYHRPVSISSGGGYGHHRNNKRTYDDDDESSLSSGAGNGSMSFLTSVLDSLYDSYHGRTVDDEEDHHNNDDSQHLTSRLQMSFSSLVGI